MMDLLDTLIEYENLNLLNSLYSLSPFYILSILLPRLAAHGSVELTEAFVRPLVKTPENEGEKTYIRSGRILPHVFYELSLRRILHPSNSGECDKLYEMFLDLLNQPSSLNSDDEPEPEPEFLEDMYKMAGEFIAPVISHHVPDSGLLIKRLRVGSEVRMGMERRGLISINSVSPGIYDYSQLTIHDKVLSSESITSETRKNIENEIFKHTIYPHSDSFIKFILLYGLGLVSHRSFDDSVTWLDFRRPFSNRLSFLLILPLLNSIVLRDDLDMLDWLVNRIKDIHMEFLLKDIHQSIFLNAIQYSAKEIISKHRVSFDHNETEDWKATIEACVVSSSVSGWYPKTEAGILLVQPTESFDKSELGLGEDEAGIF